MRRGDVVAVAAPGDFGKPRPAVVVQTDALSTGHASVIVCPFTTHLFEPCDFRVKIDPDGLNGLRHVSQIMADKPITLRRERVGRVIGRLHGADMQRLDVVIAFVMGLAG